jgi:Icc-related predicted phosphoesterase
LKILHISDTHGAMPALRGEFDVVVHSGDLMPNTPNTTFDFVDPRVEKPFQRRWLATHAARLRAWLGDKPVLITPGNHDFVDAVPYLRRAGVEAVCLKDGARDIDGVTFYGTPWVPEFYDWNFMASPAERRRRFAPAARMLDAGEIDVFVSHGPIYGLLDRNTRGERCGCRVMREVIQSARHAPKLFLHGHIHEAAGVRRWLRGILVSNAATVQRVLTVSRRRRAKRAQ